MTLALETLDQNVLTTEGWDERRRADQALVGRLIPESLGELHAYVVARARARGAHSLILSGSTARGSRTEISDLDYHLVGEKIATRDLSAELDLHVLSADELTAEILDGDDFVQWSVRFGRVLFDDGTVLAAARLIAERRPWPDVGRKAEHAAKSLNLARRVIETGDSDGALIQVRTGLSLAARAHLLSVGEFPLSRAELPAQLAAAGHPEAASALDACILGEPTLATLATAVTAGYALLNGSRTAPPAATQ